jgi:hypothetical protein
MEAQMPPERFDYQELMRAKLAYEQLLAKYWEHMKAKSTVTIQPATCTPETICELFKKWYDEQFMPWKIWVDSHFGGGPDPTSPPPVNSPYK